MRRCASLLVAVSLAVLAVPALGIASPITGVELYPLVGWAAPSTNAQNYDDGTQYVLFVESTPGSITLEFHNNLAPNYGAWFEYRLDGIVPASRPIHRYDPAIAALGDVDYPMVSAGWPAPMAATFQRTFVATNLVEIRLSFGPESDYDFNWTAFEVAQSVPDGGSTLVLLGLAFTGFGVLRKRLG